MTPLGKVCTVNAVSGFSKVFLNDTQEDDNVSASSAKVSEQVGLDTFIAVPLISITGLCGNCFTIIIMRSKEFVNNSFSLVLLFLALSDSAVLIMLPFNKLYFLQAIGTDPRSLSTTTCKVFYWVWRTSKMTSSWLVVILAAERLVAVTKPLKAQIIMSKKKVTLAILAVYLGLGSYNFLWGNFVDILTQPAGDCVPNFFYIHHAKIAKPLIIMGTVVFYSVLPCMSIFVMNLFTLFKVLQARHVRMKLGQKKDATAEQLSKMTTMLTSISVAFLVLVVPTGIGHLYAMITGQIMFSSQNTNVKVIREVTQIAELLNHSINFYLYTLCGQSFRRVFLSLFGCGKGKGLGSLRKSHIKTDVH